MPHSTAAKPARRAKVSARADRVPHSERHASSTPDMIPLRPAACWAYWPSGQGRAVAEAAPGDDRPGPDGLRYSTPVRLATSARAINTKAATHAWPEVMWCTALKRRPSAGRRCSPRPKRPCGRRCRAPRAPPLSHPPWRRRSRPPAGHW